MREACKILLTIFIVLSIIQVYGIIKAYINSKLIGYRFSKYVNYWASDFEIVCVTIFRFEILIVVLFCIGYIVYNIL